MSNGYKRVQLDQGLMASVRFRQGKDKNKPTLFFVHGLGDSSTAWNDAFSSPLLKDYSIFAPDLPGYGDTKSDSYSFSDHVEMLNRLLTQMDYESLVIIGHSMGGVISSLLVSHLVYGLDPNLICEPQRVIDHVIENEANNKKVLCFINVEGNLTEKDATISGRAVKADQKGRFEKWFKMFKETTQSGPWAKENPKLVHYGHSLDKCDPLAFLQGSNDLNSWKEFGKNELPFAGELYSLLKLPTFYFYGSESIPDRTRQFLKEHSLDGREFPGSGHWLMNDASVLFYSRLKEILDQLRV